MKTGTIVGLGVIGLIALYASRLKQFANTLQIKTPKVSLDLTETQRAFFFKIWLKIVLPIVNPTAFSGKVTGARLKLFFGNRDLGTITKTGTTEIAPHGETLLPFAVGINTLDLFQNVQEAIQAISNKERIYITISGTVLTDSGDININERIPIT